MGERALTFVLYAVRPLSPEELIDGVSFPSTTGKPTSEVLLDICRGFVVHDEGLKVLRFAHFSVQEFLLKHITAQQGHAAMADVTLNLLLTPNANPMLHEYATDYWPNHVRLSGEESDSVLQHTCRLQRVAFTFIYLAVICSSGVRYHFATSRGVSLPAGEYRKVPSAR